MINIYGVLIMGKSVLQVRVPVTSALYLLAHLIMIK